MSRASPNHCFTHDPVVVYACTFSSVAANAEVVAPMESTTTTAAMMICLSACFDMAALCPTLSRAGVSTGYDR